MTHLIDEFCSISYKIDDLVLITFSIYRSQEVVFCGLCKEPRNGLNRKVDRHDYIILLHFYVTGVPSKESVGVCSRERFDLGTHIWKSDCKLVYETVDVKPLDNAIFDGSIECSINLV